MDFKQIQELVKMINKSNIGELSIEQNDFKITIKQKKEPPFFTAGAAIPVQAAASQVMPAVASGTTAVTDNNTKADDSGTPANLITIKSPMIGTFYRKSGPDKPNFIELGDEVSVGKVVCIIEAMKLFNEIESEVSGKIVKILVEDSTPVEYDQPLFVVEPA